MDRRIKRYLVPVVLVWLTACDSGDIWPVEKPVEEMKVDVVAAFTFESTEAFPVNHRVVWGAFVSTSPYPLLYETAQKPAAGSWSATPMQTVPKGTTHMALALMESAEDKAIHIFKKYPLDAASTELNVLEAVNLAAFDRVQAQIFTPQCIQCHGAGGRLAADLDLTEGNAYDNLVGIPSIAENSPKNRVTKYSLTSSFLLDVLTDRPATVTTNHTTLSTLDADDDIALVRAWIMSENEE